MTLVRMLGLLLGLALVAAPPVEAKNNRDPQVTCQDGTKSKGGRGACSGHGGIAKASDRDDKDMAKARARIDKTEQKARARIERTERKAEDKAEKTERKARRKIERRDRKAERDDRDYRDSPKVVCGDGKVASSRLGCFGHGGVAKSDAELEDQKPRRDAADRRRGSGGDEPRGVDYIRKGATARCKDGMYSHARNRIGACSGHGGVDKWLLDEPR